MAQSTTGEEKDATPVSQIYQLADTAVLSHMQLATAFVKCVFGGNIMSEHLYLCACKTCTANIFQLDILSIMCDVLLSMVNKPGYMYINGGYEHVTSLIHLCVKSSLMS